MKRVFSFFLVFGLVLGMCVPAMANEAENVSPYYTNVASVKANLSISTAGIATVIPQCFGLSGTTITATTYLELKTGTLWARIANGQPDSQWVGSSSSPIFREIYTYQLEASGTYRATTIFVVTLNGNAETIVVHSDEIYYSP